MAIFRGFKALTRLRQTERSYPIKLLRRLLLGLLVFTAMGVSPVNLVWAEGRLIILVRHAEKADAPTADPQLSPDGNQRALALVSALTRTPLFSVDCHAISKNPADLRANVCGATFAYYCRRRRKTSRSPYSTDR